MAVHCRRAQQKLMFPSLSSRRVPSQAEITQPFLLQTMPPAKLNLSCLFSIYQGERSLHSCRVAVRKKLQLSISLIWLLAALPVPANPCHSHLLVPPGCRTRAQPCPGGMHGPVYCWCCRLNSSSAQLLLMG